MVDVLGLALGAVLTLVVIGLHYTRGTGWSASEDISQEVLSRRAESVPETDFPEPMNRAPGGGGGVAVPAGEAEGELEEGADAEAEEGPWSLPDEEAETFEVEYVKEGETLEVAENETILEAGEDEGWDLPYACREGQCLSCGGHVADGPAEDFLAHHDQEMLSGDELDDGYTLTCVAYPQADLSIETREQP
ncbi:MAG: 2Fe-2S iron-sulfur cluster-binding protein [Halobacteriales archaeon]